MLLSGFLSLLPTTPLTRWHRQRQGLPSANVWAVNVGAIWSASPGYSSPRLAHTAESYQHQVYAGWPHLRAADHRLNGG